MHATLVQDHFHRVILPIFCFALLAVCVVMLPSLAFPLALVMPLIVCPARISTGLWFALLLPIIPCAGLILSGVDMGVALCSLPFSYLSLLVSFVIRRRRPALGDAAFMHTLAILVSLAILSAQIGSLLGQDLFHGLASYLTNALGNSPSGNAYLYSLVRNGFLSFSSQAEQMAATLFGQNIFLVPGLKTEFLHAIRFALFEFMRQRIPALIIEISLVVGVFTALHTARADRRQRARMLAASGESGLTNPPVPMPAFRHFILPASYRHGTLILALFWLLLSYYGRGEVPRLIGDMMGAMLLTVYCLLGAAVWVFLLCRGHDRRTFFAGLTGAALFVLYPFVLFILGLGDQLLHIRVATLFHQEHKEE